MEQRRAKSTGRSTPRRPIESGWRSGPAPSGTSAVRQALDEFLALPLSIVLTFVIVAIALAMLESAPIAWVQEVRGWLSDRFLSDAGAIANLLGTVAGSLITVTSITLSILLVAVQQAAGSLTEQVFDQYLRRRLNQFAFGFFVGLAIFALITLAVTSPELSPVISATVTLVLSGVAMLMLVVLIYSAIDQIRGEQIVGAIHDHASPAREGQLALLGRTRRSPELGDRPVVVASGGGGYLVGIDLDVLGAATSKIGGGAEVELVIPIGGYRATGDPLALIRARDSEDVDALVEAIHRAVKLARERDIKTDPGLAIDQLVNIGWTTGSTSKQNPAPAIAAVHAIRDLIARWSEPPTDEPREVPLPVVVPDDLLPASIDALETLAIVASESMQHHLLAETLDALAMLLPRLPGPEQARAVDCARRVLSSLGDHVLSRRVERSLAALADALDAEGASSGAAEVRRALAQLQTTVGRLHSRSSRVPG